QRLLREARERLGDLERALEVAAGWDDLGHEPERERLARVDDPPAEDEVERPPQADDAGEALGAAVDERHAEAALGEAEAGVLGRDAEVAPERELHAAGHAPAGDRRDRGLARDPAREAERPARGLQARGERLDRLEVGAGAERLAAGAAEDEHARLV